MRAATVMSVWIVLSAVPVYAQVNPYPSTHVYGQPQSYTSYYNQELKQNYKPMANVRNYTYNRYFYHRPSVSPYLSLTRITRPDNLNNYYRYVRPEQERRANLSGNPLSAPQMVGPTVMTPPVSAGHLPVNNLNPYFNQFYNFGGSKLGPSLPTPASPPLPKLFP